MQALRLSTYPARCLPAVLILVAQVWAQQQSQPQISSLDRGRAQDMLQVVAGDVRKHYYDPKFHGLDWDAKVAEAKQKIDRAPSMNMALSEIAAALDALNDSHTFFLPPQHMNRFDSPRWAIVASRRSVG